MGARVGVLAECHDLQQHRMRVALKSRAVKY